MLSRLSAVALGSSVAIATTLLNAASPAVGQTPDDVQGSDKPVAVSHRAEGQTQFVTADIRIHQPPERVWPVMANPFEFEQGISPRFHTTEVVVDRPEMSVLRCSIDMPMLLPPIKYTVESHYVKAKQISFKLKDGNIKDFAGSWTLEPAEDGKETKVTYSMYLDPGIPIPQWMVRQGIKSELPHMLTNLRDRVDDLCSGKLTPVAKSLAACKSIAFRTTAATSVGVVAN